VADGRRKWLRREEHVFGALEISHYRPKERPNSVRIVHPKNDEEAWWPLFDETGSTLFPELMAELNEIKQTTVSGLVFRRDHSHRRSPTPLPWITAKQDLRYLRGVVKKIVRAADLREELSFTSFRHAGFTDGADSDLSKTDGGDKIAANKEALERGRGSEPNDNLVRIEREKVGSNAALNGGGAGD